MSGPRTRARSRARRTRVGALRRALAAAITLSGCARAPARTTPNAAPVEAARTPTASAAPGPETLRFETYLGKTLNAFYRRGPVAAHVLIASGREPHFIAAFPAGNTGAALWFEGASEATQLALEGGLEGVEREGGLRGVTAIVRSSSPGLTVTRSALGSVRGIREIFYDPKTPLVALTRPRADGPALVWSRETVDRGHHDELKIEALDGASAGVDGQGRAVLRGGRGEAPLRFRVTSLNDETPLTPVPEAEVFRAGVPADEGARQALLFLTYREKLLAGSWRFLTYFGRDTMMSTWLLMPAVRPNVIETAIGSVLDRLSPAGEVAHEEDIGEFAAIENLARSPPPTDVRAPNFDYHMVDNHFMLAPLVAHYLLDTDEGRGRAAAFLARATPRGGTYAEALGRNLGLVLRRARPFAEAPGPATLVGLAPGSDNGNWRDSNAGLGGGRYAYDINAALVPAALAAAARLLASPLLGSRADEAAEATRLAAAWAPARDLFRVSVPEASARTRLGAYARQLGIDPSPALAALHGPVVFPALALDAAGKPVAVMHSDDAFVLFFSSPPADELAAIAWRVSSPFPAGLRSPVGIFVANPAYAPSAATRALFDASHYQGTVVWSWQHALLIAGFDRQLGRADLPEPTRAALREARDEVWRRVDASRGMGSAELWSWRIEDKTFRIVPYDEVSSLHTEANLADANAAQLWSTVFLGVRPHGPAY